MKTDRFVSPFRSGSASGQLRPARRRAALLCLAGLLLLASGPTASAQIVFKFGGRGSKVSGALAKAVAAVHQRFAQSRRALPVVQGPGGAPAYSRQAVADLVDATDRDLDQSIEQVREPKLAGLRDWASAEIGRIRGELEPAPTARAAAALYPGPQAVAVVASLGGYPLPASAPAKSAPREPATLSAERAGQILDQVSQVIERLFFLARNDDLEVKLWVGSTPRQSAQFSFWPQASVSGFPATPTVIRTAGKRDHVMRGLYSYKVSSSVAAEGGSVVESFQGGPGKERDNAGLDLVNGSSFFCCRFEDKECHHVDSDHECRASRR